MIDLMDDYGNLIRVFGLNMRVYQQQRYCLFGD